MTAATIVITCSEYALAVELATVRLFAASVEETSRSGYSDAKSDPITPPIATAVAANARPPDWPPSTRATAHTPEARGTASARAPAQPGRASANVQTTHPATSTAAGTDSRAATARDRSSTAPVLRIARNVPPCRRQRVSRVRPRNSPYGVSRSRKEPVKLPAWSIGRPASRSPRPTPNRTGARTEPTVNVQLHVA